MQQGTGAGAEWRASWMVVMAAACGMTLQLTYLYSTGIVIPGLEREYGWTRAEISSGNMMIAVVGVILAPFVGRAIDRAGPRRIALIGAPLFCVGLGALSLATASIWSWWLLWGLLALIATLITPAVWTAAVSSLFRASRGFALAMAMTGTGLGAIIVPLVASRLFAAGGWRMVYLGMAGGWAVVVLPIVYFLFHAARDRERQGRPAPAAIDLAAHERLPAGRAMASARYIKLAIASCAITLVGIATVANIVPILAGYGVDQKRAAGVASLIGIGSISGRFIGGYLLDRINGNAVAGGFVALPILSMLLLLGFPGSIGAASAATIILGLAVGVEYDAVAYLIARHFGIATFGTLFGTLTGTLVLMGGIGPLIASAVYDATGSYAPALWGFIPVCILSSILFLTLGPYPASTDGSGAIALEETGARPA